MEGVIPLLYLTTVNEPLYLSQTSGLIYSYHFKDIPNRTQIQAARFRADNRKSYPIIR